MTASYKTRCRVDYATVPIKHSFAEGFTRVIGKRGHMLVTTTHSVETMESVMPTEDIRRLRLLAKEYKEYESARYSSRCFRIMLRLGLGLFWMWLRPRGRLFYRINATAFGGGVSIMNTVLMALCQAYEVPMMWDVLLYDKVALIVTKNGFHNPLHGMKNPVPTDRRVYGKFTRGVLITLLWTLPFIGRWGHFPLVFEGVACTSPTLSSTDKLIYRRYMARCWRKRRWAMAGATDIVIDDWQPSRFIRKMRGWGLHGLWFRWLRLLRGRSLRYGLFFRDHIDTDRDRLAVKGTPGYIAWRYLWFRSRIGLADKFLAHLDRFFPKEVPDKMRLIVRATSDLLDEHNRPMSQQEQCEVLALLNEFLVRTDQDPISFEDAELLVTAISRYCPPKRHDLALMVIARANQIMHYDLGIPWDKTLKMIILGNGARDDGDGGTVHEEVWNLRFKYEEELRRRLLVLRLPHLDLIKNLVLLLASLGLHTAEAEGLENGVGDGGHHRTPFFVRPEGGPHTQIVDGESGRVMEFDLETWAWEVVKFFTDPELRAYMNDRTAYWAEHLLKDEFTTSCNLQFWLYTCLRQAREPSWAGNGQLARDLVKTDPRYN
jgi:hypothetical protein